MVRLEEGFDNMSANFSSIFDPVLPSMNGVGSGVGGKGGVGSGVGGKGGVTTPEPFMQPGPYIGTYSTPAAQNMYFGGQDGQITDPTLAAQFAILGNRRPTTYQPLLTPETYQNFYTQQIAAAPPAPIVVPNYRPMAQEFKQAAVGANGSSQYSLDGGGPEAMGGGSGGGWGAVDLNDMSSMAPVTTIDATTGQTTGVDGAVGAAGGFGPGVTGDSFGGEGDSADGGGGGGGDGGCVIATHAVAHGSFTPREKRKAVVWCTKTLHNRWWGETIRKGYRWHGNRAIAAGKAHQYYEEFRDFIRFATGAKRDTHTAKVFAWRSLQFFVTGLFVGEK